MTPRLMTIQEAAAYCRLTVAAYRKWQAKGLVPGPMPSTQRYDLYAIDRALDKCSSITQTADLAVDDAQRAFDSYFDDRDD